MNVEVRIQGADLVGALRSYTVRRLQFSLGRFVGRLGRVRVRISDINGPHGGIDKSCRISAELLPSGRVVRHETVDASLFTAIERATERIGRSLRRQLEREREPRGRRESVRTEAQLRRPLFPRHLPRLPEKRE
jgi:ribosome-associated translation inhibitor RaiA